MRADEQPVVEREAHFDVDPDTLWEAITDPELLADWFAPAEVAPEPGAPIVRRDGDEPRTIGVVERVEPRRRIGFVWVAPGATTPSEVELEIDAAESDGDGDDGSVLRIREVQLRTEWERPAWLPVAPQARALACA